MDNKLKQLQLQTLSNHLAKTNVCDRPSNGWIAAIRKSLGMSVCQMAMRIGIAQQSAARLELNELQDSITLRSLRRAAEALDCHLVYALVPNNGTLQTILEKQALLKATEIVLAVDHSMQLEAQGVGNVQQKIEETAQELAKNPTPRLWD